MKLENKEIEQCVLATLLQTPKQFYKVMGFLKADHFAEPLHGEIYKKMFDAVIDGKTYSPFSIEVSDKNYLKELSLTSSPSSPLEDYSRIILDLWKKRKLHDIMVEKMDQCDLADKTAEDLIHNMIGELGGMSDDFFDREKTVEEIVDDLLKEIEDTKKNPDKFTGIKTGFPALDEKVGGFHKGRFYIIAGRAGMGKSAFAVTMLNNMIASGHACGFISLEMSSNEVVVRLLTMRTSISFSRIKSGHISQQEFYKVSEEKKKLKFSINDAPVHTIQSISSLIQRWKIKHKLDVVFVDHVGLCQPTDKKIPRVYQLEEISKGLKIIAKDQDVCVIGLAQINRNVESQENKRPTMADIRDSGSFEQDADCILILYRPEYYLKTMRANSEIEMMKIQEALLRSAGKTELIISKNRQGETGIIDLQFNQELMYFYS